MPVICQSSTARSFVLEAETPLPQALAFFNNKGGVGKTTLSCNMASLIASETDWSVLYVDCDPQCNATQLLLDDTAWEELYGNKKRSTNQTLLRILRHIRVGNSDISTDYTVHTSSRFGIDVVAGHPSLSIFEDRFSSSWVAFKGGELGGARRSLWARYLVERAEYDLVVFDLGPSLGALNRTVLLGCDSFVTPMAADLFSLYALDNIGDWITGWLREYRRGVEGFSAEDLEDEEWSIPPAPSIRSGFIGYTVQQYVSRSSKSGIRQVRAYDRYKRQIPERVAALEEIRADVPTIDLGVVPNMFSMVPLAQAAHAPITDLRVEDGLRGAQIGQQQKYSEQLHALAQRLITNLERDE